MPIPTVKTCCCGDGFSLRTAGLCFGIIALLVDFVSVLLFALINHTAEDTTEGIWEIVVTCEYYVIY